MSSFSSGVCNDVEFVTEAGQEMHSVVGGESGIGVGGDEYRAEYCTPVTVLTTETTRSTKMLRAHRDVNFFIEVQLA